MGGALSSEETNDTADSQQTADVEDELPPAESRIETRVDTAMQDLTTDHTVQEPCLFELRDPTKPVRLVMC